MVGEALVVPFGAGAQVNHQTPTKNPSLLLQVNRHGLQSTGRLVDVWDLRVDPGLFFRPLIPRWGVSLSVGSLLYGV